MGSLGTHIELQPKLGHSRLFNSTSRTSSKGRLWWGTAYGMTSLVRCRVQYIFIPVNLTPSSARYSSPRCRDQGCGVIPGERQAMVNPLISFSLPPTWQPFRNALRSPQQSVGLSTLSWQLLCRRCQEGQINPVSPCSGHPNISFLTDGDLLGRECSSCSRPLSLRCRRMGRVRNSWQLALRPSPEHFLSLLFVSVRGLSVHSSFPIPHFRHSYRIVPVFVSIDAIRSSSMAYIPFFS